MSAPLSGTTRRLGPLGGALAASMLLVLTGCPYPPGHFGGCNEDGPQNRHRILTHQLSRDSAAEIVDHPARAAETVACGTYSFAAAAAHGLFGKRLATRLYGPPPPVGCSAGLTSEGLLLCPLKPACFQLFISGEEGLEGLLRVIDGAASEVDVLMYDWDDDSTGRCIASHLAEKALSGARVRILVDGAANLIFGPPPGTADNAPDLEAADPSLTRRDKRGVTAGDVNAVVCWLARQPGIEIIRTRNPFGHYDHRKLVLADGCIGWAGGRNFTFPAFFSRHDVAFTVRGPLVTELQMMFEQYWREQGGEPGVVHPAPNPPSFNAAAHLVHNSPTAHSFQKAVLHAINNARQSVWVENPYLSDNQFITRLAAARHRGVDVRVVLTIRTSSESVNHSNRVTANRLLAAGVRVYLYPTRMHTKAAFVDGCWAYLGSGNFDLLSFRRNHELGFIIGEGPYLDEVAERLFLPDFCPDWELHQPLPLSISDRLFGVISGLFM